MARAKSPKQPKVSSSDLSTGISIGQELALLRAELKEELRHERHMLRRYARVALVLAVSVAGKSTGVPLMVAFGSVAGEFASLLARMGT